MPEGPEIRRAADRVEKAIRQIPIDTVFFAFEHLKKYESILAGQLVERVETRGKAMIINFEHNLSIYSHNQLYGRWLISKRGTIPKTNRQLRVAIHNADKSALLYSASDIEVLNSKQLEAHPFLSRLGPDILSSTYHAVLSQLYSKKYQRRQLKSLYLDQGFLAGVGNYLRSEILFEAGLNPKLRPLDCSDDQLELLAKKSVNLSRRSYRLGGITCSPELANKLKAEGQTRSQYRHWVFNRQGQACRRCSSLIKKEIASRRYYYCPTCQ